MRYREIWILLALTGTSCSPSSLEQTNAASDSNDDLAEVDSQRQQFEDLRAERLRGPDPDECRQRGGSLLRGVGVTFGAPESLVCVVPYSDAGKECTDSSQCDGKCLVWEGDIKYGAAVGTCQAETPIRSGCFAEVLDGFVTEPGLCSN